MCNSLKTELSIRFGGHDWCILDSRSDRKLIITRDIVELCPYDDDFTDEVWQTCGLRGFLNGKFLEIFSDDERSRIIRTEIKNPDNPWFKTPGGEDTLDMVFIPSLEEADYYFGHGSESLSDKTHSYDFGVDGYTQVADGSFFTNAFDCERIARYKGSPVSWWLRSPGVHNGSAAVVFENGGICVSGFDPATVLDVGGVGVRPMLWLQNA